MTIDEAREVLGQSSFKVSDLDLQRDIDVAQFFADVFFDFNLKRKGFSSRSPYGTGDKSKDVDSPSQMSSSV